MARKPTGRPRGRPKDSRHRPVPDRICIEIAWRVLEGLTPGVAANQLELEEQDGFVMRPGSKARRFLRAYERRKEWFALQAKARNAPKQRTRSTSLGATFDSTNALHRIAAEQDRSLRMMRQIMSPAREMIREFEQRLRMIERMTKGPFG